MYWQVTILSEKKTKRHLWKFIMLFTDLSSSYSTYFIKELQLNEKCANSAKLVTIKEQSQNLAHFH